MPIQLGICKYPSVRRYLDNHAGLAKAQWVEKVGFGIWRSRRMVHQPLRSDEPGPYLFPLRKAGPERSYATSHGRYGNLGRVAEESGCPMPFVPAQADSGYEDGRSGRS